ncbi:glycosyltransferase involved in cell wall biosynthesis [Kribbella aluminosa]|uniref:Glycosyltransferase involved in cell wall biosynthesis n=1 Tax=Kribbella aluminosa TaxID=416017 RepID=A0ABS4UVB3_9ACTN|nr:glycosyltransferase family A protein [Kribbella aluminosa]MBP2355578.1 glycosyltransferase involved in cell wall biosynthesis [Kribbella aluminosa]
MSVDQAPRFTVVIPAYNEERFIADCLRSLAQQDFAGAYEVVVVDNNCTDGTAEIARRHGAVVVAEEQPGVCPARHRGSVAARGEIVVSSDADTVFDSGWLSRIDRTFRQEPDQVAVAGPCRYVGGPWWGRAYAAILFGLVHLVYRLTGRVLYVTATNIAFRKDAWSGYDLTGTQGADELGLLSQLQARGRVAFDLTNPTFTSARRLTHGLAYNLVVSFIFYYALAVALNRMAGRAVIGTAPAFRNSVPGSSRPALSGSSQPSSRRQWFRARVVGMVWLAGIVAVAVVAAELVQDTWLAKR